VQHSNAYIIGFAAAVCVVCGFLVSVTATSLKTRQDQNILLDRQKNVLTVAGLMEPGEDIDASETTQRFEDSIRASVITLATGEATVGVDADSFDQQRAAKDPARSTLAPPNASKVIRLPNEALVYEVVEAGEVQALILPIQGMGLWSVLYGYIALESDARTIRGITYYQQGETAGLGGEVDNPRWKALWVGRKAFDERGNVKIAVKKGAAGPADEDPYRVDGLAGATITSRGVTNMLRFWLGDLGFTPYLERYREQRGI
jgi:Na+-transporting NADH:ubiquinone oxidoreductase subunit C